MDIKFAALIVQLLVSIAFNLMGSFLPLFINADLGYTLIDATYWTGIAQLISSSLMAFTAPFWGLMCDRVGTKKILILVLVGNTIVYAGMGLSTSILQIILFRGLQGTFGGISTVMFSLIASVVSNRDLKNALSYQMAAMTLGGLIGPGMGGVLASIIGYRLTFVTSSILFISMTPLVSTLSTPPPAKRESENLRFGVADLKAITPDIVSLIMVYACISFIVPTISWFLETQGIPHDLLLTYTALATILNGIAFAAATPILTKLVTDRSLPLLSAAAAVAIFVTAFVNGPTQFIALRIAIGAIQAGIPPNLLGGKSGRKGASMGFLNSARFMGMAIGPFMATFILGNGEPPRALYMFSAMATLSLLASLFTFVTHTRKASPPIES